MLVLVVRQRKIRKLSSGVEYNANRGLFLPPLKLPSGKPKGVIYKSELAQSLSLCWHCHLSDSKLI